jgi:Uma2 family endonuclease
LLTIRQSRVGSDASEFTEPTVIFGSPTQPGLDRGEKFEAYQQIPTLDEYILVTPRGRRVEVFRRAQGWAGQVYEATSFQLAILGISLQPEEVFEGLA